eukprot:3401282-Pyramimonas_sp.AAC.1
MLLSWLTVESMRAWTSSRRLSWMVLGDPPAPAAGSQGVAVPPTGVAVSSCVSSTWKSRSMSRSSWVEN